MQELGVADWLIFTSSLILWCGCGVFYAVRRRGQSNTSDSLLVGDRKLPILPTALSIVASYMSAVSLLGYPAEIYQFGVMFCWYGLTYLVVFPLSAYAFVPVFFDLNLTSAYAYFELRFDRKVRYLASVMYLFQILLYMSVVLYAPSLALSSVSPISTPVAVIVTGVVATFYAALGGATAVVWVSAFQMLVIFAGLIAIVVGGVTELGSFDEMAEISGNFGRLFWTDFRLDPRIRHSFWSLFIGGTFTLLTLFSANQLAVQRYIGMPRLKDAQVAMLCNIPLNALLLILYTLCGLILFYAYHDCDPMQTRVISRYDQMLPHFVAQNFGHIPGFTGLLICCVYSAGLSTISGGVNCLTAVILEDIYQPIYLHVRRLSTIEEKLKLRMTTIFSIVIGVILIGGGLLLDLVASPTVLQIALSVFGIIGGPLLGSFILGMFIPQVNASGAFCALIVSSLVTGIFGVGAIASPNRSKVLPTSIDGCSNSTGAFFVNVSISDGGLANSTTSDWRNFIDDPTVKNVYGLSYQYYALLSVAVTLVVGICVSALTGWQDQRKLREQYFSPFVRRWLKFERNDEELTGLKGKEETNGSGEPENCEEIIHDSGVEKE